MFEENGYIKMNEVLLKSEILELSEKLKSAYQNNVMTFEGEDWHYKNSYGIGDFGAEYYDRITALVEVISGFSLEAQNSYGRIYFDGGVLKPHVDREGLELTLSLIIDDTTQHKQVLSLKDRNSEVQDVALGIGEGLLLMGRELEHWRDEVKSAEGGALYCVFYHWKIRGMRTTEDILKNDLIVEEEGFVIDRVCERMVKELSDVAWQASRVYQNGMHEATDYRTSETVGEYAMSEWGEGFLEGLNKVIAGMLGNICVCRFEGWQASKYEKGDLFDYHNDTGIHADNERLYTVILYLNDDFEGGETDFRNKGVRVKPKKGKLVVWRNLDNENRVSNVMEHSGLQILEGTKYVLVNFIRLKAIN